MNLIKQWGRNDIYKVIHSLSEIPLMITTLIMLFIYQLTFIALTFSFGLLGIKASDKEDDGKMPLATKTSSTTENAPVRLEISISFIKSLVLNWISKLVG